MSRVWVLVGDDEKGSVSDQKMLKSLQLSSRERSSKATISYPEGAGYLLPGPYLLRASITHLPTAQNFPLTRAEQRGQKGDLSKDKRTLT